MLSTTSQRLVLVWLSLYLFKLSCCCFSDDEVKSHPHLSLAALLGEEPSVAKAKRGGAWGFPSKTVGAELTSMPVEWWYNWGNYIPNADAAKLTQVIQICAPEEQGFPSKLPNVTVCLGLLQHTSTSVCNVP